MIETTNQIFFVSSMMGLSKHLIDVHDVQQVWGVPDRSDSPWVHLEQCEAPKIAFSWFITPITMVYGTYNYSYWGL